MYIRKLRDSDIDKILQLNNTETDLSFLKRDRKKHNSIGVFENNILTGYVLLVKDSKGWVMTDFYSNKAKHYIYLFGHYFISYDKYDIKSISFELTLKQTAFLKRFFQEVSSEYRLHSAPSARRGYCEGYMQVHTPFTYKRKHFNILNQIYKDHKINISLYDAFDSLKNILTIEDLEKTQHRVVREVYRRNMGYLEQMHPEVLTISKSTKSLYNMENEKFSKKLEEIGFSTKPFTKKAADNFDKGVVPYIKVNQKYRLFEEDKYIVYYKDLTFKGFQAYDASLALYRFYIKKAINHLKDNQNANRYWILDREGYPLIELEKNSSASYIVPHMFKTIYSSKIKSLKLTSAIKILIATNLKWSLDYLEERWESNMDGLIDQLRKVVGEEATIQFFIKEAPHFSHGAHNWNYYQGDNIWEALTLKKVWTRGTFVRFLEMNRGDRSMFLSKSRELHRGDKKFSEKQLRKIFAKIKSIEVQDMNDLFKEVFYKEYQFSNHPDKSVLIYILDEMFKAKRNFRDIINMFDTIQANPEALRTVLYVEHLYSSNNQEFRWRTGDYPLKVIFEAQEKYGLEVGHKFAEIYCNRIFSGKKELTEQEVLYRYDMGLEHDFGYLYEELMRAQYLGKKEIISGNLFLEVVKSYSKNKLQRMNSELRSIFSYRTYIQLLTKTLIQEMKELVVQKKSLKPILDKLDSKVGQWLLKKYKNELMLNEDRVQEFINRMKRYMEDASITIMYNTFGKEAFDMIAGRKEGLFKPAEYSVPNKELAKVIKRELAQRGKDATGHNPQRLFTHLNKIRPVQELMKGNASPEDLTKIAQALNTFGVEWEEKIFEQTRLKGLIEPKCSPEYLVAGNASVCCMSFGEHNAMDYALHKGFGVFNIYYKDRVIANSVIWINEVDNKLVLDNIEVHPNYTFLNKKIKRVYLEMVKDVINQYELDGAVQGCSYSDLTISKGKIRSNRYKAKEVDYNHFYTDAHRVQDIAV